MLLLVYNLLVNGVGSMINFIICDDNKFILKEVELVIDRIFMSNKLAYRKHLFNDYDSVFFDIIKQKLPNKIYILDIETPSNSGVNIAREIRSNDYNSIIIFLTAYKKYSYEIIKSELLVFTFISKLDDYKKELKSAINKTLKILGTNQYFCFRYNYTHYTIPLKDILYITTDKIKRCSVIFTNYSQFYVNYSLDDINHQLNKNFVKSHRSCIINKEQVRMIDYKNNMIVFKDNTSIDLLSREFKKEIKKTPMR